MEKTDLTREQIDERLEKINQVQSEIKHLNGHIKELSEMSQWSLVIHKIGNNSDIRLNCEGFDKQIVLDTYLKVCNEKIDKLYEELKNILTKDETRTNEPVEGNA